MTKEEVYDNLTYELTFSNGIIILGTIDKVSQHFADFDEPHVVISDKQPDCLKDLIAKYKEDNAKEPIELEDWLEANL